jgi:hypothetical protein
MNQLAWLATGATPAPVRDRVLFDFDGSFGTHL